jgi:N-methylhydantoinase B/oxoprolinase/acetone carboxylase alpha subunit
MPNGQSFSTDRSLGGGRQTAPTKTIVDTSGLATVSKVAATAAAATSNVVSGGFNAGSFRMAEAASMGTTINLTVTGAFDREGTARTIVETLNSSAYRGTGGAGNLVAL